MIRTIFLLAVLAGISFSIRGQEINQTDSQGRKQGAWIKKLPDGTKIYEGTFRDNKPVGTMTRYFETGEVKAIMEFDETGTKAYTKMLYQNGELAAEGELVRGQKNGEWKYYSFYDKTLTTLEEFLNGVKHGEEKKYYSDGTLAESIHWKNGKKHGDWKQFHENGQVKAESAFVSGLINGSYSFYRDNGMPEAKGKYYMGKMDGTWFYYDDKGKVTRELHFKKGIPQNEDELTEEEMKFFELMEKNQGKFEEPSIEDFLKHPH